jgi:hypothetical protein
MSREIFVENYEDNALAAATSVVLSDAAGLYGIRKKVGHDLVVAAAAATTNPSLGVYVYDVASLDGDLEYEYVFKITRASGDIEYVSGEIPVLENADGSESTLSLEYNDLLDEVAYFLFGKAASACSAAQQAVCDTAVQNGYRQFLYPPTFNGVPVGYEWSFLRPTTTITTTADDADQDMPGDFGSLLGAGFVFAENAQVPPVLADVGEGQIRNMRASMSETGHPRWAGLRRKAGTGTTGQRWEVMWHPTPDDAYVLSYLYEALVDKLSVAAPYPLGGLKYASTLRASCLAAADEAVNDGSEKKMDAFIGLLISAIKRDREEGPKFFGNVGCHGEHGEGGGRVNDPNYTLSVGGEQLYP